jgi:hypothetical protein
MLPKQRKETQLVFEVYEDGTLIERIEERSVVGVTSRQNIHRLLRLAGFRVQREWSDYRFKPFHEGEPLLIVEAVKQDAYVPLATSTNCGRRR